MRRLELITVSLQNFRSFRAPQTIELSPSGGFKMITGLNLDQPRLGANGVGKSTLWDAVAFCLYNSSVKGLRASDLATWTTKQAYVQTEWLIDGEEVSIARWSNPNKLMINEKPAEQATVDRIIGMSRLRFMQSVIFGQAVPLFIDLPVPERGLLLDEVLDLSLWLKLSEAAGQKHTALSKEITTAQQSIAFLAGKLAGMPTPASLEEEAEKWDRAQDRRISLAIDDVEAAEVALAKIIGEVEQASIALDALPKAHQKQAEIAKLRSDKTTLENEYKRLREALSEAEKTVEFYNHHKTCPTCSQTIAASTVEMKQRHARADITRNKTAISANSPAQQHLTKAIDALVADLDILTRKRDFHIEKRSMLAERQRNQQAIVDAAARAAEIVAEAANPFTAQLTTLRTELEVIQKDTRAAEGVKRRTQGAAMRADFWKAAFKRVRLFMVKRVLTQLDLETETAVQSLGLIGWRISFTTELETKSGSLRPGIFATVTTPEGVSAPWEAFSGGEAQRIRVAVAIGLSTMIQRLAGLSVGFEVWDEPSSWLSAEGIEDLLTCLKRRADATGKSLWICDHRALIYSGFDEIWQVCKTKAGSTVSMLSSSEGQ